LSYAAKIGSLSNKGNKMEFLNKLTKLQAALMAIAISFSVAATQYTFQTNITDIVIDAQMGIVELYALASSALLWVLLSLSIYMLIRASMGFHRLKVVGFGLITIVLIGHAAHTALVDAADSSTSPERLRELVNAEIGLGYELHNRIANNSSTPVQVLESLYGIEGQIGTDLTLARNPNTPNHILIKLSKRHDSGWRKNIVNALQNNPKVRSNELYFDASMTLRETEKSN
jgi:hypothetical protein